MKIFKQYKNGLLYISKDGKYKFFNIKTGISGNSDYNIKIAKKNYLQKKEKMI
jgi:hypothetical protein